MVGMIMRTNTPRVLRMVSVLGLMLLLVACGGGSGGGQGGGGEINPDDTSPIQMTMAGASSQGFFRTLGESIGSVAREEYPGSSIGYEPGSPAGSLAKAATGRTEIAAPVSAIEYRLAREGTEPFQESLEGDFTGVMRFYEEGARWQSIMTKSFADEHGITSLRDIAEKKPPLRISINQEGNTQAIVAAETIFEKYGFSIEDIESWGGEIFYQSSGDGINLLADRRADMYFNGTFVPESKLTDVARSIDLVWVSMDEDIMKSTADELGILPSTVEPGEYEFVTEEQPTIAIPHEMVANPDIPAQDIYKLVKAVYEHQEDIQALHPAMEEFSGEEMIRVRDNVPLHPGAEQFYREEGLID